MSSGYPARLVVCSFMFHGLCRPFPPHIPPAMYFKPDRIFSSLPFIVTVLKTDRWIRPRLPTRLLPLVGVHLLSHLGTGLAPYLHFSLPSSTPPHSFILSSSSLSRLHASLGQLTYRVHALFPLLLLYSLHLPSPTLDAPDDAFGSRCSLCQSRPLFPFIENSNMTASPVLNMGIV